MIKMKCNPNGKLDLNKRETQGVQCDAPPTPNGTKHGIS